MPVIKFSVADKLRAKILDAGWYSWQISSVTGPVTNSKKDGFNYEVYFHLIDVGPDLEGKEIKRVFSNKAMSMMLPLFAAAQGITFSEMSKEEEEMNTDTLIGCKIDGLAAVEVYEGNPKNVVDEYAPYKSIVGQTPGF